MADLSIRSIVNARNHGDQMFKFIWDNWGNSGASGVAGDIEQEFRYPIVGAQIAPESTVGEVQIEFNAGPAPLQKTSPVLPFEEDSVYIKRGEAFFWRTAATITLQTTRSTGYGDLYYPVGAATPATTAAFGGAVVAPTFFVAPILAVNLFFDHVPPIKEAPAYPFEWNRTTTLPNTDDFLFCVYPVQYRKKALLILQNSSTDDLVHVRVCGVRGGAFLLGLQREVDLLSAPIVVPRNNRLETMVTLPDEITYLTLKTTKYTNTDANMALTVDVYAV